MKSSSNFSGNNGVLKSGFNLDLEISQERFRNLQSARKLETSLPSSLIRLVNSNTSTFLFKYCHLFKSYNISQY
jgi:hypothetical protein